MKNTVTVYNLTENDIIGSRKAKKEDYDLVCLVMIGLGNHEDAQPGTMLKMLDVLFSNQLKPQEKKELLEDRCEIPMKEERIEEEVEAMCSLGQGIYEEGVEQGVSGMIRYNLDEGVSTERIIYNLIKYYGYSKEKAVEMIEKERQLETV